MVNENHVPVNPQEPGGDEITPAVENFNDGDNEQVLNTANDAFDEAGPVVADKMSIEEKILPPGSTDILDNGAQPVLNGENEAL